MIFLGETVLQVGLLGESLSATCSALMFHSDLGETEMKLEWLENLPSHKKPSRNVLPGISSLV
jgi:hypothetical protein